MGKILQQYSKIFWCRKGYCWTLKDCLLGRCACPKVHSPKTICKVVRQCHPKVCQVRHCHPMATQGWPVRPWRGLADMPPPLKLSEEERALLCLLQSVSRGSTAASTKTLPGLQEPLEAQYQAEVFCSLLPAEVNPRMSTAASHLQTSQSHCTCLIYSSYSFKMLMCNC